MGTHCTHAFSLGSRSYVGSVEEIPSRSAVSPRKRHSTNLFRNPQNQLVYRDNGLGGPSFS
jgi:hypothetical protein